MKEIARVFERTLRLKLHPVAVKFCRAPDEPDTGKVPTEKLAFCQMVRLAAQARWELHCPKEEMGCFTAQMIFGFREQREKDVEHHMKQFTDDRGIAEKMIAAKPKLKPGDIEGLVVGPLGDGSPDFAMLILDSGQALPLIEAYGTVTGKDMSFRNGTSSALCSYGVVVSHQTQQPNLSIPCVGAKRYGLFQDQELVFTIPSMFIEAMANALSELDRTNRLHLPILNGFLSPTKPVNYLLQKDKLPRS